VEILEVMDLITIDFETYYDKKYSLKKLTTEEYIRDSRFEVIGVGVKLNNNHTEWASGNFKQTKEYLHSFDWKNSILCAHNTMFDGAILAWIYDVHPSRYADTLCIARAVHGVEVGGSLSALSEFYGIGQKGEEVHEAIGKRREDFSEEELDSYGDYCVNDVDLTYELFKRMGKNFPKQELKVIDTTLRMFIDPALTLCSSTLKDYLVEIRDYKEDLIWNCGIDKENLMSNPKFAEVLLNLGVIPPMKVSPTTGKETYAFAKTDDGFKELLVHKDVRVQAVAEARLGNKSTIEETRTERFIDIAERGSLPVPLRYYAAHTGRWGGDGKINMQNLSSRGEGKKLKKSILAPEGHVLVDCDSSQIEARVLAWLAEQDDLVDAFTNKEDVYVKMASKIYKVPEDKVTKQQRFVGKTTILGAGYGMGAERFAQQLRSFGVIIKLEEARRIIDVYRKTNSDIKDLWSEADNMLIDMHNTEMPYSFGRNGIIKTTGGSSIILPSGLLMKYNDLEYKELDGSVEFTYRTRNGRTKLYGGKVIENVCQAFARCIIADQMLAISAKYKVALTVHDSVVCMVLEDEMEEAVEYVETCMSTTPEWADGLPIACESGVGYSYGECGDG